MGATMASGSQRFCSLRNPFARCVILAVTVLGLVALTMSSDVVGVRAVVVKSAMSAKQGILNQYPLGSGSSDINYDNTDEEVDLDRAYANKTHTMDCNYDLSHLRQLQQQYQLQEQFLYYKRYVKVVRQAPERRSMTKLSQRLMAGKSQLVDVNKDVSSESCPKPLEVPVTRSPYPSTANLSDYMFGVSTTYKRFTDQRTSPVQEWTYWLTDQRGNSNGGKLVLLLMDATEEQISDAWHTLHSHGIDADVFASDSSVEMAVRYLSLVPTLYNHPDRQKKRWLVTCDDDTFFPTPNLLVKKIGELDHNLPLYIGTLSEDVNQIERHGSQAFGGAGVFLSVPLAKMVNERFESCKADEKVRESNSGWGPQGDILLRKCIYENSETRLYTLDGLWQLDLTGDPAGFYESGLQPISLHHYRGSGWHTAYPGEYSKISHICGEDCMMQRFHTADDFVLSAGFSIAHYPQGANLNFGQLERTFSAQPSDKGWNMDFSFGPQRESLLHTGRKIAWELRESTLSDDASVSQVYVRKRDDSRWKMPSGEPMSQFDGVIELVWV